MHLSIAHCIMQRGSFLGFDLSFYFYFFFEEMQDYYLNLASWPAGAPFATSGVSLFSNPHFRDNPSLPSKDSCLRSIFCYYYLLFRNSFYLV